MKKLALLIVAVAFLQIGLKAQDSQLIKVGIGVNSNATPIEASYERGVKKDFLGVKNLTLGLGVYGSYYGYNKDGWSFSYAIIGARALVHYPIFEKLEAYAGFMLGYDKATITYSGPLGDLTASGGGFQWNGVGGLRYVFNDHWGVYAEANYSSTSGASGTAESIGVAYKF